MAENYQGDIEVNLIFNRLSYLFSYLGLISLYIFSRRFSASFRKTKTKPITIYALFIAILAIGIFIISDSVVGSVAVNSQGKYVFTQGSLIFLTIPIYLVLSAGVVKNLLIRAKNGNYAEKNQARFIIFGLALAISVSIPTNILIPAITNQSNQSGPSNTVLTVILALITSYALIKHRILDVRPFASRLIAVVFLLITIGLMYALAVLVLQGNFFGEFNIPEGVLLLYIIVLLGIGLVVHPLHRFYRGLLDRVFIKNLYDSQTVIDSLNKVLVSNLKTTPLLNEIQAIIRRNLGSSFTVIKLNRKGTNIFHQGRGPLTIADLSKLDYALAKVYPGRKRVVSIRDILVDATKKDLADLMIAERISVIAPIRHGTALLGMLYISDKRYELPYSDADLKVIEIIVDQTALAIENVRLYEEVTEFNETLKDRVSTATKELRRSNSKLIAMDKAKDEFISISSHQLRTPLTTVKGYLSMLLDGNFGRVQKSMRAPLEESLDSTHRISFVVSDLLNLVRLRTDKLEVNLVSSNLVDIVSSEVEGLKGRLEHRGLQLEVNIPEHPILLMLDQVKIRQAIKNFIYNAIFYTPSGGSVKVVLEDIEDKIIFKVIDTGIGVPKNEQKLLFTQFYRAKNAQKLRPDGTGVGLYISKAIISAHGGKVLFENANDTGSVFGFSLVKNSK